MIKGAKVLSKSYIVGGILGLIGIALIVGGLLLLRYILKHKDD